MDNDTSSWEMGVRPHGAFNFRLINHHGLLPEFLKDVYLKQNAKLHELEDELDIEIDQQEAANIRTVGEATAYLEKLKG